MVNVNGAELIERLDYSGSTNQCRELGEWGEEWGEGQTFMS